MFSLIGLGKVGRVHWHTDFEAVIDGEWSNFSKDTFIVRSEVDYMQNGNGTPGHEYAKGVSLTDFFSTVSWEPSIECIRTDTGEKDCTSNGNESPIIVNGDEIDNPNEYKIQDGDQIRVIYE